MSSSRFYVYVLCRPNGKPFYVGKGTGRRAYEHEGEARSGHKCHKCNVIRKIWREGGEVQRYIVFTTDDEQEAFTYEKELIVLHGRKNLCNLTDGGDGISGAVRSAETRARMSRSIKAALASPEQRAKISSRSKVRTSTPEARAKMRAIMHTRYANPDELEKIRETLRNRNTSPEHRAKVGAAFRGRKLSPEHRAKLSAAAKARSAQPGYLEKLSAAQRKRFESPEARSKLGADIRAGIARVRDKEALEHHHE